MTTKRKKVLKPQSTEDLVDAFFSFMMYQMQLIYGDSHTDWWNKEGKALFYEWGKKQGIKFTEIDFTLPHFPKPDPRFVEVGDLIKAAEDVLPLFLQRSLMTYEDGLKVERFKAEVNNAAEKAKGQPHDACQAAVLKAGEKGLE